MEFTTAAETVRELNAIGVATCPLTGREFPVPVEVARDPAYRWRLISKAEALRILREAFPRERLIRHWAGAEDLNQLPARVRAAAARALFGAAERQELIDVLEKGRR